MQGSDSMPQSRTTRTEHLPWRTTRAALGPSWASAEPRIFAAATSTKPAIVIVMERPAATPHQRLYAWPAKRFGPSQSETNASFNASVTPAPTDVDASVHGTAAFPYIRLQAAAKPAPNNNRRESTPCAIKITLAKNT